MRPRSFCLLVAMESSTGKSRPLLVLRADPDDREAQLSIGHPFFVPRRAGHDRVGVWLTSDTDWEEIRELVIASYRSSRRRSSLHCSTSSAGVPDVPHQSGVFGGTHPSPLASLNL
jgi:hypothetical protein